MLRGFRHTLFLLLQVGVLLSAAVALVVQPEAWRAVAICVAGALLASLFCERIARNYLKRTLGRLRRATDEISRGRTATTLEAQPGDDFHKLVQAINHVANRLSEANEEEQRLEEELRRRERLAFLGELAATVAHEVNNPLDGVQNCARILRRSLHDPQRADQMLDLIDSGLSRIELIVRRLLTLARENVIRPERARVGEVVDRALEATREKFTARGIEIERLQETGSDAAMVDRLLLEQVFVNLLLNAADSMESGGRLTVAVRRCRRALADTPAQTVVCVDVSDTGTGIPATVLPHIFEPFYTTKAGGRGTGLGLPIAARVVDAHRGTVRVEPRDDGGTTFTVEIPAAGSERATAAGAERTTPRTAAAAAADNASPEPPETADR